MEFDEVLKDLNRAVIHKQEISCIRHQRNGQIRWVIDISDPAEAESFQNRLTSFFDRFKPQEENECR